MLKAFLLIAVLATPAFFQTAETSKSYVFGEANTNRKAEVIAITARLKKRLQESLRSKNPEDVYVMFHYREQNVSSLKNARKLVLDTLYGDCRDCFGWDPPRITFIDIRSSTDQKVQFWLVPPGAPAPLLEIKKITYPAVWFAPINDPNKPDWEILPQEAKAGEVILSKRNELGILSNFAATPFELYGKRYASVEGFWQMMLYPEGPDDERAKAKGVEWKYAREEVAQMTAFKAKSAGTLAEANMKTLGIDWVTFDGKRFLYRSATPGEHYKLILAAMRAKANQNPEVKRILLATGDLTLKPDHHGEPNPPPEWKYYDLWMQIRKDLSTDRHR